MHGDRRSTGVDLIQLGRTRIHSTPPAAPPRRGISAPLPSSKDIRAFPARGRSHGESVVLQHRGSLRCPQRAVQPVVDGPGDLVFEKKVTVLGAAFKPTR